MEWGMVTWVVPLDEYPDTYNGRPLSYISLASQKDHLALYLMGLNASPRTSSGSNKYAERGMKLDMGNRRALPDLEGCRSTSSARLSRGCRSPSSSPSTSRHGAAGEPATTGRGAGPGAAPGGRLVAARSG